MTNLFVYGTLQLPEIVSAITGKNFRTKQFILQGYRRFKISDPERFKLGLYGPAMVEWHGGSVDGHILFDVDEESLRRIDKFEEGYEKQTLKISIDDKECEVLIYLGSNFDKKFLQEDWEDLVEFKRKYLKYYLKERIPKFLQGIGVKSE